MVHLIFQQSYHKGYILVFIGIDFSMTSTAICVEKDGIEKFYSFVSSSYTKVMKSILIDFGIDTNEMLFEKDDTLPYSETEFIKLKNLGVLIDTINSKIFKEDCVVAIEALSFGGSGMRSLDLAGYQYAFRHSLLKNPFVKRIDFFSPKTIKAFAFKGNSDKEQLAQFFSKSGLKNDLGLLVDNQPNVIYNEKTNKYSVKKPIDDLIDSYYIKEYLKKYLKDLKNN